MLQLSVSQEHRHHRRRIYAGDQRQDGRAVFRRCRGRRHHRRAAAEEQAALRSYGRNLGLAFQLVDDALDYSGEQASSARASATISAKARSPCRSCWPSGAAARKSAHSGGAPCRMASRATAISSTPSALMQHIRCARRHDRAGPPLWRHGLRCAGDLPRRPREIGAAGRGGVLHQPPALRAAAASRTARPRFGKRKRGARPRFLFSMIVFSLFQWLLVCVLEVIAHPGADDEKIVVVFMHDLCIASNISSFRCVVAVTEGIIQAFDADAPDSSRKSYIRRQPPTTKPTSLSPAN